MNIVELVNRGWTATLRSDPGLPGGEETALATRIPGWNAMSWAGRMVHRAAYGFDENGELVIGIGQMSDPETRLAVEASLAVEAQGEGFALPGREMPGSDERLRKILQDRSAREPVKHDDSAVVWMGEDQSVVYTCEQGWGITRAGGTGTRLPLRVLRERETSTCGKTTTGSNRTGACPDEEKRRSANMRQLHQRGARRIPQPPRP